MKLLVSLSAAGNGLRFPQAFHGHWYQASVSHCFIPWRISPNTCIALERQQGELAGIQPGLASFQTRAALSQVVI